MEEISIIIPAYNEEERIEKTLEKYTCFLREKRKERKIGKFELLVVLNGCKDNTIGVVKGLQKKYPEIIYLNFKEGGKGFAVINGFKDALRRKKEIIGFVDADMSTPPEALYDLIKKIDGYDGIIASRWMKKSIIMTPQTTLRKITSRVFNFFTRSILLLNFKDTQCGAKFFKRNALGKIINQISITKWAFDIDLLYLMKREKLKVKEIPTFWNDQKRSKINLTRVPIQMFLSVIRLRLIYSPFKFIIVIYDKLPNKIKIRLK